MAREHNGRIEAAHEIEQHEPVQTRGKLTWVMGAGVVMADMAGVGVLTTTGFMARELGPRAILAAWLIGGLLALAGAVAYGAIAQRVARSGGEYRYLSELLHPAIGLVAGWTSFIVGFSAPVAMAAYTAGAFAETLSEALAAKWVGTAIICAVALLHGVGARTSFASQNLLAVVKLGLLVGFVLLGIGRGANTLPDWPHVAQAAPEVALSAFVTSLVYIAFSYSGWNSAIYAAEEFAAPKRDVPLAMRAGTLAILLLYLGVNFVFVAGLPPERMQQWTASDTSRVTLAHLLVGDWLGGVGGAVMSAVVVVLLVSSVSAMTLIGPRVYASMANDGFLPKRFAAAPGVTPRWALLAQATLSLVLLWTQSFEALMQNVGAVLTASAALTSACVIRLQLSPRFSDKPGALAVLCGCVYFVTSIGILGFSLSRSPNAPWIVTATGVVLALAWLQQRRRRARSG